VERLKRDILFEDYKKGTFQNWFVTGKAFGPAPCQMTQAILSSDPDCPVREVVGSGVANSGQVSNRLQGAIRSKTFIIQKKKVFYRVAGQGSHINLIIDNYQRIRDPIYGGLTVTIDHGDQFEW